MTADEAMDRTSGSDAQLFKSESEATTRDQHAPAADDSHRTPKKRRKVNHGEYGGVLVFSSHS
jgi:hypothetical protein